MSQSYGLTTLKTITHPNWQVVTFEPVASNGQLNIAAGGNL